MQHKAIAKRFDKCLLEASGIAEVSSSILLQVSNPFVEAYTLSSCTFKEEMKSRAKSVAALWC